MGKNIEVSIEKPTASITGSDKNRVVAIRLKGRAKETDVWYPRYDEVQEIKKAIERVEWLRKNGVCR